MDYDEARKFICNLPDESFLLANTIYYECCCDLFEVYTAWGEDRELTATERLEKMEESPQSPVLIGRSLTQPEYQQIIVHHNEGLYQALEQLFLQQLTYRTSEKHEPKVYDLILVKFSHGWNTEDPWEHYQFRYKYSMFGGKWNRAIIRYEETKVADISDSLMDWLKVWVAHRNRFIKKSKHSWDEVFTPAMMDKVFSQYQATFEFEGNIEDALSPKIFFTGQEE